MNAPVYMTAPKGGVHVALDEGASRALCGVRMTQDWEVGDETMSGLVATCPRCKSRVATVVWPR